MTPIRLTAVLTHPVQYYAAWFRHIAAHCPQLALTVVYATEPSADQQGVGFDAPFKWDVALREGYANTVVRAPREGDRVDAEHFRGLDVPDVGEAVLATGPDVVLVFGWYSVTLVRATRACRRAGIPVLVFSDSQHEDRGWWRERVRHTRTRALLWWFDAYLVPGTRAREYLIARGAHPTRVFRTPHAVDADLFMSDALPLREPKARASLRQKWGASADEFVVLFAGKFQPSKRIEDLIDAAALRPGVRLLLVGRGPLEQALRDRAAARGARVTFAGFLNQRAIVGAYAAADCLALASSHETWGLVVNEALAAGLPVVVSNRAGCAPDLVVPGETGEVFNTGDPDALAAAIDRCRLIASRPDTAERCRRHASRFSHEHATTGLVAAAQSVVSRHPVGVVACLGGMVLVGGLERMTLEVLRVIRDRGGRVHALLNDWENHWLSPPLEDMGASWVGVGYRVGLRRRRWTPVYLASLTVDVAKTNWRLFVDARAVRASHVLFPDLATTLRNAPALILLKAGGTRAVVRVGNAPPDGALYARLWRVCGRLVNTIACNSRHTAERLAELGVSRRQIRVIYNTVGVRRATGAHPPPRECRQIAYVGQIIPEKGPHLAVAALRSLLARGRDCSLVIVGDVTGWAKEPYAVYRDELLRASRDLQASGRLTFTGFRDDVPELLASCGVLCCPSLPEQLEGAPGVVLEAKQVGTPTVAFDIGPFRELIRHGIDGWLCSSIGAEPLADAIDHLLSDRAAWMRMSQAAKDGLAEFGRDRFVAEWWRAFESAAPVTP